MTKVNPNNGIETKSDIFVQDIFRLKYFNDFYHWKRVKNNTIK